ncbi:MAG: ankyrin repeat domain-containing protein [Proteobacteria bacterium]|nr:ankyrin repeat domain-containing protein [Pseudomonadota bacterium]
MLAAVQGHEGVVHVLLENGADMNVAAKYNLSALMLAVLNRHTEIAKQLVDAGADTQIRGRGAPGFFQRTAGDLAAQAKLHDLAAYIAQAEG